MCCNSQSGDTRESIPSTIGTTNWYGLVAHTVRGEGRGDKEWGCGRYLGCDGRSSVEKLIFSKKKALEIPG